MNSLVLYLLHYQKLCRITASVNIIENVEVVDIILNVSTMCVYQISGTSILRTLGTIWYSDKYVTAQSIILGTVFDQLIAIATITFSKHCRSNPQPFNTITHFNFSQKISWLERSDSNMSYNTYISTF